MIKMFCVFLLASLIPVSSLSVSQKPEASKTVTEPTVTATPAEQKAQNLGAAFPKTELTKHTARRDAERYLFDHEGKPLKVTAYSDGQFKIQLTREFTNKDIDELADAHPDLLKYVTSVPDETENAAKVKVRIETEVTYRFDNELEFERDQPELCAIFRGFKMEEDE